MGRFRFEDLEIWREALDVGVRLSDLADRLEASRLYRWSEQLRGAALSVSNNIAEGAGSSSNRDFRNFLNIARRSVFENANMLLFFVRKKTLQEEEITELLEDLRRLCARILAFSQSLNN